MIRTLRGWAAGAVLALAMTAGGCAGAGWEDVLNGRPGGYGYETDVRGEVRGVGSRHIELRTDGGRHTRVRYDGRTDVRYRDRRYSARALERGDIVVVRVDDRGRGEPYARFVTVRRSARAERVYDRRTGDRRVDDRRGDGRRYPGVRVPGRRSEARAIEGRVGLVEPNRPGFQLQGTRQGTVYVTVSRNANDGLRRRVAQLRRGQYVQLRGRFLSDDRFEVEGFR